MCCHMVQLCAGLCTSFILSFLPWATIHHPSLHCVQHSASTACTSPGVHSASAMHTPTLLLIFYRPACFPVQFSFIRLLYSRHRKIISLLKCLCVKHYKFKLGVHGLTRDNPGLSQCKISKDFPLLAKHMVSEQ